MPGPKIAVIGSANADLSVYTPKIPAAGETLAGTRLVVGPGGKGANQAVAAKRAGGEVLLLARVGDDFLAETLQQFYQKEGIDTAFLLKTAGCATGSATILVEEPSGENRIVIVAGANGMLSSADVARAEPVLATCQVLLCQNEIPAATVEAAFVLAKKHGIPIIYNPAPFRKVPSGFFRGVFMLTPNETEAEGLTGQTVASEAEAFAAGRVLRTMGAENAIITLGGRGAALVTADWEGLIPPFPANPVDTTGAGDAFNGALAVAIAEGKTPREAALFAAAAGALAVAKPGAAEATPRRKEIEALCNA